VPTRPITASTTITTPVGSSVPILPVTLADPVSPDTLAAQALSTLLMDSATDDLTFHGHDDSTAPVVLVPAPLVQPLGHHTSQRVTTTHRLRGTPNNTKPHTDGVIFFSPLVKSSPHKGNDGHDNIAVSFHSLLIFFFFFFTG
jgi:hypothetical protein